MKWKPSSSHLSLVLNKQCVQEPSTESVKSRFHVHSPGDQINRNEAQTFAKKLLVFCWSRFIVAMSRTVPRSLLLHLSSG